MMPGTSTVPSVRGQHPAPKPDHPADRWMVRVSGYPRDSLAVPAVVVLGGGDEPV
jgi:hypothetical protein